MRRSASDLLKSSPTRHLLFIARVPVGILVFITFVLAGFLQFASVDWSRSLSIYDEVPHVDYVLRLAEGDLTTWDSVYSQRTLGMAACLEEGSTNPQCITGQLWKPQERWPNGHSYEAWQTPVGYLPFAAAEVVIGGEQASHFSQIRNLRLANVALWLVLAAAWTALVLQVSRRRLPVIAASVVVALNPLLFDRFTYVTNDSTSIAAATGVAAWSLYSLRDTNTTAWWPWISFAALLGTVLGLVKPTALIVLMPIALAVAISRVIRKHPSASARWWTSIGVTGLFGVVSSLAYQVFIDRQSLLDREEVLAVMLPRGPLDLATASLLRLGDMSELVIGTGARTELTPYEWGVRASSVWLVLFSLAGVAAFLLALTLRNNAFPQQPALDSRVWAYAVIAGAVTMLIAHPALHFVRGEFLMPFTAGRFLGPLVGLAGLALLPAFQRFRWWSGMTIVTGLLIAAFASAPIDAYLENLNFIAQVL